MNITIHGNPDFESEELTAYEAGYRFVPDRNLSLEICAFYNDYDHLEGYLSLVPVQTGTAIEQSIIRINQGGGNIHGLEISAGWQATQWLKANISYSWLDTDIPESQSPEHQLSIRAGFDLTEDLNADIWIRYVDDIEARQSVSGGVIPYHIDDYLTIDLRAAWRITDSIEIILAAQNLLDSGHMEFVQNAFIAPTTVPRSFYGQLKYRF